jgi:hypothetical protein
VLARAQATRPHREQAKMLGLYLLMGSCTTYVIGLCRVQAGSTGPHRRRQRHRGRAGHMRDRRGHECAWAGLTGVEEGGQGQNRGVSQDR